MEDEDPLIWMLLLQLLLIGLNAIFACTEIAVISLNKNKLTKLAQSGDKRAIKLEKLTEQPARFLSVIQVGITLAGFLASAFAAENFSKKLVSYFMNNGINVSINLLSTASIIIITLILSYFTLVFGELVPKRIGMKNAEKIGLRMSGFIYFISILFIPIIWLLTVSTNIILRLFKIDPKDDEEKVTEEEIREMVDIGSQNGAINDEERKIINNVFDFNDKAVREIMTHRKEASIFWLNENTEQWEKLLNNSPYSIYPICDGNIDNVIGILYSKDYFKIKEKTREVILKHCLKQAYFVPETIRANRLFQNMQKNKNHFAVVLDEHGGMRGIVTMNDLLEKLVGNLENDATLPDEPPEIECIDSKKWIIQGTASIEAVCNCLKIKLPDDNYNTFGGFVFSFIGKIPKDESVIDLEIFGIRINNAIIKNHRLVSAIVSIEET